MPSRLRIWVTASREDRSMSPRARAAASGSRSMTRRAAAAWMPMTETWWPTTSCSSRAMRSRSSVTARRRRLSLCSWIVLGLVLELRALAGAAPRELAADDRAAEVDGVDEEGEGDGGRHRGHEPGALRAVALVEEVLHPAADGGTASAIHTNMPRTMPPTTSTMSDRSRDQATAAKIATK